MPIQSKRETLHFKDEDGQEIADATFTIRRLSHEAADEYRQLSAAGEGFEDLVALGVDEDGDSPEQKEQRDAIKRRYGATLVRAGGHGRIVSHLLKHGLVSIAGVLDDEGRAVSVDHFQEQDDDIVGQVVQALQERLAETRRPNGRGRSATS